MTTPPRPTLDETLARIDAVLDEPEPVPGWLTRSMFGPPPSTDGPPNTHVHTLPSVEDDIAAAPSPSYTVTKPGRSWHARAIGWFRR